MSDRDEVVPTATGPGASLRAAREAAGMSREDVAHALNLDKAIVDALESDDTERLPQPTYVKGYLRAYARLLELDAEELLSAYTALEVPAHEVIPRVTNELEENHYRIRVQVIGGLVALVLIVLLAWWLSRPKGEVTAHTSTQTAQTAALAASASRVAVNQVAIPTPVTSAAAPAVAGGTASVAAAASGVMPQVSVTPAGSSTSPGAAQSANIDGTQLLLTTSASSWVQIDDASGAQLLRGLLNGDARETLSGKAPFQVFLGYAPGVSLIIDGKHVDASPYTRSNNTARFTLMADGTTHR